MKIRTWIKNKSGNIPGRKNFKNCIASKEIQWCNYYCYFTFLSRSSFLLKNSIYCFFFSFLHTIHSFKSTSIIYRYIQKSYNIYAYHINKWCDPKKKKYIYIKEKRKETKEKEKKKSRRIYNARLDTVPYLEGGNGIRWTVACEKIVAKKIAAKIVGDFLSSVVALLRDWPTWSRFARLHYERSMPRVGHPTILARFPPTQPRDVACLRVTAFST